jgi:hypothetical protein
VSERVVPPGGEAQIEVKVNTRNRRGELVKTVRVMSNDPENPRAVLKVRAKIDAPPLDRAASPGPAPAVRDRARFKLPPGKIKQAPRKVPAPTPATSTR